MFPWQVPLHETRRLQAGSFVTSVVVVEQPVAVQTPSVRVRSPVLSH